MTDVSWNYRVKKQIQPFKPRPPDAADGTWRMGQADVDRVQEFRKCIECFLCQDVCHVLRDHHKHDAVHRPAFPGPRRRPGDAPARHRRPPAGAQGGARHRLLQHHQVLHQGLPGTHHHHRQRHHSARRNASSMSITIRLPGCCTDPGQTEKIGRTGERMGSKRWVQSVCTKMNPCATRAPLNPFWADTLPKWQPSRIDRHPWLKDKASGRK